ncbi:MAG: spermidine synthase [Candidatus Dactylopiibacterium sp.]|nr:spermidine synthase [Candidatus Dactylopiibacterium sp.]
MTPIDIREEDGIRYLHFGSDWVQGAMRIRRPFDLHLEYTRDMMAGLLLREGVAQARKWPRSVLLVGLGAGSLSKFCYARLPDARVTTVEIDDAVWAAASFHFKLPAPDARFCVRIEDGADYLCGQRPKFDYILIDGYDEHARVGRLESEAFYQACRARLKDGGILAANLFGRARQYAAPLGRLAAAFEGRALALPPSEGGNVIALATTGNAIALALPELKARAVALKAATGLDLRPLLKRLAESGTLDDATLRL